VPNTSPRLFVQNLALKKVYIFWFNNTVVGLQNKGIPRPPMADTPFIAAAAHAYAGQQRGTAVKKQLPISRREAAERFGLG